MRVLLITMLAAVASASTFGAAVADGAGVVVSKRDCQRLLRHEPSADVDYQPGVGVGGRRVAPADLPGSSAIQVPKEIQIPIGIDLAERFGIGDAGDGIDATAMIGTATVRGGKVYFDGKPVDGGGHAAVVAGCKEAYGR